MGFWIRHLTANKIYQWNNPVEAYWGCPRKDAHNLKNLHFGINTNEPNNVFDNNYSAPVR